MLEKIALQLTSYMIVQGVVSREDAEIYVYGWTMLLFTVGSFAAVLAVGAFWGQLLGTAVFLFFFTLLRSYAGGYHSDSFGPCFLLTMTFYTCSLLPHFYLPEQYWDVTGLILLSVSVVITYIWAPIDHPNHPFKDGQREKNQKLSRITVTAQTIVILSLRAWQPGLKPYLLWAVLGMAVTSLTLLYVIYHPYKK